MSRLYWAAVLVTVSLVASASWTMPVDAQGNNDLGGQFDQSTGFDRTVTREVVWFESTYSNPVTVAARPHPLNPSAVASSWPHANSVRCAEKRLGVFRTSGLRSPPTCVAVWVCGGERIDELVSGRIAGDDARGRYAEYLDQMIGSFGADVAAESGLGDAKSVNSYLLDQGLSGDHDEDQIPVFYWCGKQRRDSVNVTIETVSADPTRSPSFGWDTTVDAEYDIPALRNDALVALRAEVGFDEPELGAVPPIEKGFTWVKWPTWFWVKSALDPVTVSDENSVGTRRLDMRAVVDRVEWSLGGEILQVCLPDQMLAYDKDQHDPVTDAPPCNHSFDQIVAGDLKATVFYRVEEKIRQRNGSTYPDIPWSPHPQPESANFSLSTTIPDYGVHEIYSVNTPIDMTDDEIADLLSSKD